jgi:acyl carrier protein
MTSEQIVRELEPQIRAIADVGHLDAITPAMRMREDLGMDSLTQVDLILFAERTYAIEVPDDVAVSFVCLDDLAGYVLAQRAGQ